MLESSISRTYIYNNMYIDSFIIILSVYFITHKMAPTKNKGHGKTTKEIKIENKI